MDPGRCSPVSGSTASRRYPCALSTVVKIAGPLGGLRGRQISWQVRRRVDGVHDDRHRNPGRRGEALRGRDVERCGRDVWIRSSMSVPVRAEAVMMCGSAEMSSVVRDGSAGPSSVLRFPGYADMRQGYGAADTWPSGRDDPSARRLIRQNEVLTCGDGRSPKKSCPDRLVLIPA